MNVQTLDIKPTVLALSGLHASRPMQGDSLAPLLRGEEAGGLAERYLLTATYEPQPAQRALIHERWKLIALGGEKFQLFDMQADPGELKDLAPADAARAKALSAELAKRYAALPEAPRDPHARRQVDGEFLNQLRKLGYLQ